ncbi:hypothetical protein [Paenibacillus sp. sgz500958]|uniref:hypothetical protein n=1 Tax=Paenibacillus sp. sgz500958 TaxID=3242475 RepID=UPI0036D27225
MKIHFKKVLILTIIGLYTFIGAYFALDQIIIIDRKDKVLGIYDFMSKSADARILVEGTGEQHIDGKQVSTTLKIIDIEMNKTAHKLVEGQKIKLNERFVIYKNRQIGDLLLIPGRSIYGMGTDYKRLEKGEQQVIEININDNGEIWIVIK